MNNEINKTHTYGDFLLSEEYDRRIERRKWLKQNKSKLFLVASCASALVIVIAFLLYMI